MREQSTPATQWTGVTEKTRATRSHRPVSQVAELGDTLSSQHSLAGTMKTWLCAEMQHSRVSDNALLPICLSRWRVSGSTKIF